MKAIFEDIGIKDYKETWDYQESVFQNLIGFKTGKSSQELSLAPPNHLIFVEHPHVYTLGKSGSENNLLLNHIQLQANDATFYKTNRGGDITYHGPGQIVGYPIFDIERSGLNLREYIFRLEEVIINAINTYGLTGERLDGATGVWLDTKDKIRARKICAIGVRASRYVTMHGFALNVNTDLKYFTFINPCGYVDKGVTSLQKELSMEMDFMEVKALVKTSFEEVFQIEWL
jgi:lipoyl(octanoyl) transferase